MIDLADLIFESEWRHQLAADEYPNLDALGGEERESLD
jgi:hypothetical protein